MHMNCYLFVALALGLASQASASIIDFTIYCNSGLYTAVDSSIFPAAAFNPTPNFTLENARLVGTSGDTFRVKIVNTDTVDHGFKVTNKTGGVTVAPGDSQVVEFSFMEDQITTTYFDHLNSNANRALGLGGIVHVKLNNTPTFYWNLKEFQKEWAIKHANNEPVNWTEYYPDYFTVNGRSNPHINSDPVARVTGSVDEALHIVMANTGQSIHSIHFHGYHAKILYSSESAKHSGRSKDTFPIKSMQALLLEIVPDKVGEYPVHDHNLVAVSAGGVYPNGMFLTILIE